VVGFFASNSAHLCTIAKGRIVSIMNVLIFDGYDDSQPRGSPSGLTHIGNDIWFSASKNSARTLTISKKPHYRFLDNLYIPDKTTELSAEQIVTINRFRERTISSDPQYAYRDVIRDLFCNVLSDLRCSNVIELGPGRFPLPLRNIRTYSALEIDPVAIHHLKAEGINVFDCRISPNHFDVCVGVFVFHFNVGWRTLKLLGDSMTADGVFVFNVVTSMADVRIHAFSKLSRLGFSGICIDLLPVYTKNDAIFICSKDRSSSRGRELHEMIVQRLESEGLDGKTGSVLVHP
jgi:hypothetical protein